MMLVHGCSNIHHMPRAAARMHSIITLAVMTLPSHTFLLSLRPKGFDLDLNVLPLLLGGLLILAEHDVSLFICYLYIYIYVCVFWFSKNAYACKKRYLHVDEI